MAVPIQHLQAGLAVGGGIPEGARLLLWVVIGLLLITLAILIAMVAMMRRKSRLRDEEAQLSIATEVGAVVFDDEDESDDDVICPECFERWGADLVQCPSDGRRLVLRSELEDLDGRVCPICSRGFVELICFCPHDGAALVVADPRWAQRLATAPGETSGKICPRCRTRHEYRFAFCTKDGHELRILN